MQNGVELKGKRVLVVGLARTGVATALFCAARGARVTVTEERGAAVLGDVVPRLRGAGCTLELGGHGNETFLAQDLIVPSPGVPAALPGLAAARAASSRTSSTASEASSFGDRFLRTTNRRPPLEGAASTAKCCRKSRMAHPESAPESDPLQQKICLAVLLLISVLTPLRFIRSGPTEAPQRPDRARNPNNDGGETG